MTDFITKAIRPAKKDFTSVATYGLLEKYVRDWVKGDSKRTFLVILGRPGILKTSGVKTALTGIDHLYIQGDTGPLALYRDLYLHRNQPVVLDDVPVTVRTQPVLQQATDSYHVRTVRWGSTKPIKVPLVGQIEDEKDEEDEEDEGEDGYGESSTIQIVTLPVQFQTSSQVCVVTNSTERIQSMAALLDRAYVIEFNPTVSDVLDHCKKFVDVEVWKWAKRHEKLLPHLSVRDLVDAGTDKKGGFAWEKVLRDRYLDPHSELGAYLTILADLKLKTAADRFAEWNRLTHRSRAEFFRLQKEYRKLFPTKNLPRGPNRLRL